MSGFKDKRSHLSSSMRMNRGITGSNIKKDPRPVPKTKKDEFQLPGNVKDTLLGFTKGQDCRPYTDLICILRDSEVKDEDLCNFLRDVQDCVSLMDQNLRLLVEVLLVVKWIHRAPDAVAAFQNFILNLCSAHNYHTKAVLGHLVRGFREVAGSPSDLSTKFPIDEEVKMHQNVHHLLKKLLKVVPMAGELLMPSLDSAFPYLKDNGRVVISYVNNMLKILDYQPQFKHEVLRLIVDKMIGYDVAAPRSAIEDAEDDDEMDVDSTDIFLEQEQGMKHKVANLLDHLMLLMFSHIKTECTDLKSGETTLAKCYYVYKDFLPVFEKNILLAYNTHHIQYIMWYICSLKPKLVEVFLKDLWLVVTGLQVAPVTRQAAAAYVSSFLARAKFVKVENVKVVLQDMSDWIHSYINNQDGQKVVEMKLHTVFYSVCQGLFYIVCFRHKELFKTKQNVVFLKSLNLTKMVTCNLNPLRVCLSEIVKKFAAITRAYQLVYCNPVIERNSRNTVPIVFSKNSVLQAVQPTSWLDCFFPFDPYKLQKSSALIVEHYNIYEEDDIREENIRPEKVDNDDDDFLTEPMSISTSLSDKRFSYSCSPGFLQDPLSSSSSSPRWKYSV